MALLSAPRTRFNVLLSPKKARSNSLVFNLESFLHSTGLGKSIANFKGKDAIFRQGDKVRNVFYVQKGGVKLIVANKLGREAVVAILEPGDFFGEVCLGSQPTSIATAVCLAPTTLLVIKKREMIRVLRAEQDFSDYFIAYMLGRNTRAEQDLIDQLFNNCEKRLARTLLVLAQYGKADQPHKLITNLSQETLAQMIGTTRSHVSFFMNKFRDLDFIRYSSGFIQINKSLLSVVLDD